MEGNGHRGPGGGACWAPRSALYLRPDGQVAACCATGWSIGTVTGPDRATLAELWRSARLAQQADALADGSFALGCQECAPLPGRPRAESLAHHFDRWATGAPLEHPRLLDLALSNTCNLRCVMCNGNLSSSIRAQREHLPPLPSAYDDRFFEELFELLPHVDRLQFKGGEPFLALENRRIWDHLLAIGHRPEITVTTNGTVWDERVERYLAELAMEPNISIDAVDGDLLASIRVGTDPTQVWANVDRIQATAATTGQRTTLSFCLMTVNWEELPRFLLECERRDANASVIAVYQPHRYDLLRRAPSERSAIAAELDRQRSRLGREDTTQALDSVVASLRAGPTPVDVQVRPPASSTASPSDALTATQVREVCARVDAEHGVDALHLRLIDGVVADAQVPAWAADLGAASWPGSTMDEVERRLLASVDAPELVVGSLPAVHQGTERLVIAARASAGQRSWTVTRCLDDAGGTHLLLHPERARRPPS